ncbi:MAG: cell division protein ZapA [Candidatus Dadabacteria bacterium]|nr:MAG: cell division protein ZapA [Candidatus Dadabacteria bacterium]
MKNTIAISIAGQSLTIRADDDEQYVRALAAFVDGKIREISRGQQGITTLNLALTAALAIADELFKLRESQERMSEEIDRIAGEIEARLQAEGAPS